VANNHIHYSYYTLSLIKKTLIKRNIGVFPAWQTHNLGLQLLSLTASGPPVGAHIPDVTL
jgi:hypothetical protein